MPDKKKWVSYSKRMATKKHYVLLEDKIVLGVFTTLSKVCKFMEGKDFPSYWTLTRKDFKQPQEYGNYSIQLVKND